ncbi:glycosyltransferase [Rhodococcus sp. 1163]|uniref:glycosyltransferase n=1 Tax=Rhodococcus sp. 1163 TaxID=1905289 RepID=UPI00211A22E7|nr:glycosyltransferase [Rhodococcus sp. 1163]
MASTSNIGGDIFNGRRRVVVDLLDDWSIHYAFKSISSQVEEAYRRSLGEATAVTANSEGTLALAKRFGRDDAVLLTNGCDPHRFITNSHATGPRTIGYVGKIGRRVDLGLVLSAANALPNVKFVFAGPILDREYLEPLKSTKNIDLLGDVHYQDVPALLSTFDLGWVPHRVGEFEIGGDVIKTYEYRAAHLPVLTTPVIGAGDRGLNHVHVVNGVDHADWLLKLAPDCVRVPREGGEIPLEHTWEAKAKQMLTAMLVRC